MSDKLRDYIVEHGWNLIQDDDCHWYMIPAGYNENFREWVAWMSDTGWIHDDPNTDPDPGEWDYESMMIDGPESLTIFEYS